MGKNKFLNSAYNTLSELSERDGNQLKKVTDYCDELTYAGAMDFKDGASEQVEYTWDANGNMTSDLDKGLTEIQYNVLNLPEKITHSDGHITYITYAADGRKLRVTYKIDPTATIEPGEPFLPHGSISPLGQQIMANGLDGGDTQRPIDDPVAMDVIMTRDYCGAYTYRNGAIERIMMGNGFWQDSVYYVQVKDYQGNVRAVLDRNHNLVERNEYYPYGGLINASDSQLQPYKYSSKELDRENGLDFYDSQARWYDPMLPGTTIQDLLAEKYYSISPYTWCAGNPVRFIDPSGMFVIMWFYKEKNELKILDLDHFDSKEKLTIVTSDNYIPGKKNQVLCIRNVFSGGKVNGNNVEQFKAEHKPIPYGEYDILDNLQDDNKKHKEWFRLDKKDSHPFNDRDEATGRNGFRLHKGTESYGCITINSNSNTAKKDWDTLCGILNNTSKSKVYERRGKKGAFWLAGKRTLFGTIVVK